MPKFSNIKRFPFCSYRVDVSWNYLEDKIKRDEEELELDLNPDFQREHVWTKDQQISYCEYILKGGTSGKELYFNCPGWGNNFKGPYVVVDGKQRLNAVRQFLANKIPVFGYYYREYEDSLDMMVVRFSWNIAALETREEVLRWYIDFNSGGVVHTEEELEKVRKMLKNLK